MPPLRQIRRSRRLSHKSPMEVADYDWQGATLRSGSDVQPAAPSALHLLPPSPSACTTSDSDSPNVVVTHLPFTPGSSHTRNRKEGHIPRPPNAFMVFRSWLWNKDNLKNIERDNRNVSRIAGRYWNELSEAERAPFRSMAEEAKARHAQLYPQYRYSPGSQKKLKATQRRSQRSTDAENEKCKKVADMLLGGIVSRDLAKYLDVEQNQVQPEERVLETSSESVTPIPRHALKRPLTPRGESPSPHPTSRKQDTFLPSPSTTISQYAASLPFYSVADERSMTAPYPEYAPELAYPLNNMEEFVATDDIPYLSLDSCNGATMKQSADVDFSSLFALSPSHLKPGAQSVFSGVKPEATSFVDSCVLGAYTTGAVILPAPSPFTDFDVEAYSSSSSALIPLGSPVFSNPFEPSSSMAAHSALLGTLDQLFGQSISPLTPMFSTENW